jgi:peptide deformylase
MIRPIQHDPMFLSQKSQPATKADLQIGADLLDTFNAHRQNCIGMAANMIGQLKTIIVIDFVPQPLLMFNPQIVQQADPYQTSEGCLSLKGQRHTTRFRQITVTFYDRNFKLQRLQLTDLYAEIVQHEIDHCNGILI